MWDSLMEGGGEWRRGCTRVGQAEQVAGKGVERGGQGTDDYCQGGRGRTKRIQNDGSG